MSTPFDFINTVNNKTAKIEMDQVGQKDYTPYIINRGFSNNMQTVMFANEMNRYSNLPKEWQYDFYYYGIPKGKRFDKWAKKEKTEIEIENIMQFYHINNKRAVEFSKILNTEQLTVIKTKLNRGGNNAGNVN